ncbi:hypothetical protein [Streptomyces tagetis]|uniref:Uncharacterized protein n=1 Tax=Streptomyces tagetis TaxID=2820809 RepID=A0A940XPP5_9ACTN|nr:hypothetical protein [Streptomyces sp. RG38]MBQ0828755.1 hypothetical protein [Streptomyces sp. RG38]
MADKGVEQDDERGYGAGPWWGDLGTWGAVVLIGVGGLAAGWVFLRPFGSSEETALGYYQAARVAAIGLVIVGSALLSRRRTAGRGGEESAEGEPS